MKNQTIRNWVTMAAIAGIASGVLTGCAWSVGGGKGDAVLKPTRGQELIDLKHARDSGAITEQEYQAQKKRILDR